MQHVAEQLLIFVAVLHLGCIFLGKIFVFEPENMLEIGSQTLGTGFAPLRYFFNSFLADEN